MKKGLFLCVAFLVLFILLSGCREKKGIDTESKKVGKVTGIRYKPFFELSSGVSTNLNAISYYNSARGIAVGDHGTILFTKNGGHNWQSVGIGTANLYGAAMVDSLIAITVGDKGTILRSNNGGKTWYPVMSENVKFSKTLRAVAFYSEQYGYAVGDSGVIFITPNAGEKWIKVYGDGSKTLNAISFNKTNIPFIVGINGTFAHSTNKGANWTFISRTRANLRSIHFFGPHSNSGFAVGDKGVILITTNGGSNWTTVTSPVTKNLRGVYLYSSKLGYAVGDSGTVLRYNGKTWESLAPSTTRNLNAVDPVYWNPSSTCVGENGLIMLINPPPVNDNGTSVTLAGQEDCIWTVTITTKSLRDDKSPVRIIYKKLEVCSSMEQSDLEVQPGSGWVLRDQFFNRSVDLEPDQVYPSEQHPLDSLTLLMNPYGEVTSGYFSCYLMDNEDNIYLLSTYEIECSTEE